MPVGVDEVIRIFGRSALRGQFAPFVVGREKLTGQGREFGFLSGEAIVRFKHSPDGAQAGADAGGVVVVATGEG